MQSEVKVCGYMYILYNSAHYIIIESQRKCTLHSNRCLWVMPDLLHLCLKLHAQDATTLAHDISPVLNQALQNADSDRIWTPTQQERTKEPAQ